MKLIFYAIFICIHSFLSCSVKPDENALIVHDKKAVVVNCNPELKFTPYNDNRHTVNINNVDSEYPCLQLYGENLRECMKVQSKASAIKHFKKFDIRTAHYFLMLLYMTEYREFLSLFSETDWQDYLNQLSPDDRAQMPQTVKEQLDLITKAYIDTYNAEDWYGLFWQRIPHPAGNEDWWKEMRRRAIVRPAQEVHLQYMFQIMRRLLYKKQ